MIFTFELAAVAILLAVAAPALAEGTASPAAPASSADAPAQADPADPSPFGTAATVAGAQLAKMTGQANIAQEVQATNTSTVANNTVDGNSVTGNISFGSGAFQNLNGLSVLSANSGNNVAINASLNVNVAIHP